MSEQGEDENCNKRTILACRAAFIRQLCIDPKNGKLWAAGARMGVRALHEWKVPK